MTYPPSSPRRLRALLLLTLCLSLALSAACQPAPREDNQNLIIFAASSLTDAFEALAADFEIANPGVTIHLNFGSSSQLAVQLLEGAAADLYASANETQMQVVIDSRRINPPAPIFASNRLTVILPQDDPAGIESLLDLARPGLVLVLAAPGVPVRQYTDQALEKLAADPAYGANFRQQVYANLVSEEDNVRQVVAKVALGEADAGLVYSSDVTPDVSPQLAQITIPEEYNVFARYPAAVLDDAPNPDLAQAFLAFLLGDEGQAILQHWGFGPR